MSEEPTFGGVGWATTCPLGVVLQRGIDEIKSRKWRKCCFLKLGISAQKEGGDEGMI
jgi:hypothetical protein